MNNKTFLLLNIFIMLPIIIPSSSSEDDTTTTRSVRRRSHRHQNVCRREFLRPLDKRIFDVDVVFKGVVEKVFKRPKTINDLDEDSQQKKRHLHPMMIQQQLKQRNSRLILDDDDRNRRNRQLHPSMVESSILGQQTGTYRAVVKIKRIIRGDKNLQGSRVIVEGFGSRRLCESDVKDRDFRIFLVNEGLHGRLRLNGSLLRSTTDNMRKVVVAAKSRICRTQDEEETVNGKTRCKRRDSLNDHQIPEIADEDNYIAINSTTAITLTNATYPRRPTKAKAEKLVTTRVHPMHVMGAVLVASLALLFLLGLLIAQIILKQRKVRSTSKTDHKSCPIEEAAAEGVSMLDDPDKVRSRRYWSDSELS